MAWGRSQDVRTKPRLFELLIGARPRIPVGPPAVELRCVAEPFTFHVIVADFDHTLGPQRHDGRS
jgi:hypothetical protein